MTVLHIDASARHQDSVSRALTARIVSRLGDTDVIRRDLDTPLPIINETWVGANFTPADTRTATQRDALAVSDSLLDELRRADTLIIGTPIYNFALPANLKAWVDMIARAGESFRYTEAGPEGLLTGKRAVLVISSGGTALDSPADFATPYLRFMLNFVGITDIEVIAADRMALDPDTTRAAAEAAVDKLAKLAA